MPGAEVAEAREAKRLVDEAWQDTRRWKENFARAQALLESALKAQPDDTLLLTCYGTVLSDCGFHEAAIAALKRAVQLGAADRNVYFNLGVALMNSAARRGAMKYFNRAAGLEVRPDTWEAYFDPQGH